jgi:pimeloyl-ACP methyl ester carboxylesterase
VATFVLIPGFWLGGWAWHDVTDALRAAGHAVYPVTLTGLGDRVHLAGPQVNVDTHVDDVTNLLRFEELSNVVLVGHSYGAVVGAAVATRMPERVARLVCVDSGPMPDGVAMIDFNPPSERAAIIERVAAHGEGWRYPMPSWEQFEAGNDARDMGDEERRRLRARAVDQPFGSVTQPVRYVSSALESIPRTAIWCTLTVGEVQEFAHAYPGLFGAMAEPGWEMIELPTGHWPMFTRPRDLADVLAGLL